MNSLRNLDLNLLVVFEKIFTAGNISQAARELGVSQPTISNSLARLRETLDDPLFVRAGRGITPTPKAEQLIQPVRDALQMIQIGISGDEAFDPARTSRKFKMIIAGPLEPILMPALINDLPQGSDVSYDYFSPLEQNIEQALMSGSSEMAIFLLPTKTPELRTQSLCPIDLVAVARTDHPRLPRHHKLTLVQMQAEDHVVLNLQPGKLKNARKFSLLQSPMGTSKCRVSSVSAIARVAASTDLMGMLPRLYANYAAREYGLNVFDLPLEMNTQHIFMIWHQRHDHDNAHIWLRERVISLVDEAVKSLASS